MKHLRWIPLFLVLSLSGVGCGGASAAVALYNYYVIYKGFQSQGKDVALVTAICTDYDLQYHDLDTSADRFVSQMSEDQAKTLRGDSRVQSVDRVPNQ